MVHIFGREFTLQQRLRSKKNRTFLVREGESLLVLKLYRSPHLHRSAREHRVLGETHGGGIAVPRPLAFTEGRALLMEYIPGENLCDLLNRRCRPEYVDKLARWLASFHRCFRRPDGSTLLRGDANLRNFILHPDGTLHGVDLEEAAPGDPWKEIGQICASILDTAPMFTPEKAALCCRLIARYRRITGLQNPESGLTAQIASALLETAQRRPRQRRYLYQKAKLLARRGLSAYR